MRTQAVALCFLAASACATIYATRPNQELNDAIVAVRAAKEVQAEALAPGLFRKAQNMLEQGKREYNYQNFEEARLAFLKAKSAAEQAEFSALKSGGSRNLTPSVPGDTPAISNDTFQAPVDPNTQPPADAAPEASSPQQ